MQRDGAALKTGVEHPDLDTFITQGDLLEYFSKHAKPSELKDCLAYQWALLCTADAH